MGSLVHLATGIAVDGRGLLLEGPPGSGKSTLALALIDRGAKLIGDDAVRLEPKEGRLWASPPPNIAGKIEIRNVGIAEIEAVSAPVSLVLRLGQGAPRYPDRADIAEIAGAQVPLLTFDPAIAAAALRAEWALRLHGLEG